MIFEKITNCIKSCLDTASIEHSDIKGQMESDTPCVAVDRAANAQSAEWAVVFYIEYGGDEADDGSTYVELSRARTKLIWVDVCSRSYAGFELVIRHLLFVFLLHGLSY